MTEKAQPEDLAFLSRTATELVEISFETDLYAHICTRLRELAGDVPVVVASYDKVAGTFTPRAFQGAPKVIDLYMKTAGVNPIGKEYHLSAAAAETMHARHMKPVTIDLYELSEHTVPALVCRAAEMAMNLGGIYAMGFTRMNELLGCASIFMPKGKVLERQEVIETFIHQAAVALQRRRLDVALRKSVSLLTATLESTADGLLVVDTAGRITDYNRQFAAMWGMSEEVLASGDDAKAIGHILGMLKSPGEFVARVKHLYHTPEETSFDVVEFKDGRIFERYSQPQRIDGSPVGRVWSFRDVTVRNRAEAELKKSEQRYRQVVEGVGEVIFETDAGGLWTFLNPAWTEITGFSAAESVGVSFLNFVYPEDRERNMEFFRPLMERKKDYCRHEIRYCTKAGGFKWIEVHARLLLGESGEAAGTAGTLRDITEQKRAAEELRTLFQQTERDARTKAELLSEVNHRVKNNLMAVQGLLLASRRQAEAEGHPDAGHIIENIAVRIDGLLSVHKLLSESRWGPIRVGELAEAIIARVGAGGNGESHIRLDVDSSDVEISPRQASSLALVFNELATNTLKHAVDGRTVARIAVSTCREGDDIRIEYRDDGPGYPADIIRHKRPSMGMRLVDQLVTGTLRGRLELPPGPGAVTVLHIRVEESGRT